VLFRSGFGFLIPRLERFQILGTIWSSTVFTNRAPADGVALTTNILLWALTR
jgi:protoporphyrinogen oxidase